jgi:hypothetical protein
MWFWVSLLLHVFEMVLNTEIVDMKAIFSGRGPDQSDVK